jgi:hypothetical protein
VARKKFKLSVFDMVMNRRGHAFILPGSVPGYEPKNGLGTLVDGAFNDEEVEFAFEVMRDYANVDFRYGISRDGGFYGPTLAKCYRQGAIMAKHPDGRKLLHVMGNESCFVDLGEMYGKFDMGVPGRGRVVEAHHS